MQNAAKPVKSRGEEEETERLRQELLKKEKELLEFKKQEIDKKLQSFKQQAAASVVAPVRQGCIFFNKYLLFLVN